MGKRMYVRRAQRRNSPVSQISMFSVEIGSVQGPQKVSSDVDKQTYCWGNPCLVDGATLNTFKITRASTRAGACRPLSGCVILWKLCDTINRVCQGLPILS